MSKLNNPVKIKHFTSEDEMRLWVRRKAALNLALIRKKSKITVTNEEIIRSIDEGWQT